MLNLYSKVSSTSNASLTSSVKKRKAPKVPPPALSEHSEVPSLTSIIQPSSRPSTPVSRTADGDSESTISHASTPSDVAVSPIPPPAATSTPSPSVEPVIDEDEVVVRKPEGEPTTEAEIRDWNHFLSDLSEALARHDPEHGYRVTAFWTEQIHTRHTYTKTQ